MNEALKQNIITELHLDALSEEQQAKTLMDIGQIIYLRILSRVLDELSEEAKNEFNTLLETKGDDEETIYNFLSSKIPKFEEICQEEIARFKQSSQEFLRQLTNIPD